MNINAGFLTLFILHCLTVMDEVKPSFQKRSVKTTGCISTSITSNAFLPKAPHPKQEPLISRGTTSIAVVNNRKGSPLPVGQGPQAKPKPSQLHLSISGPGGVVARSLADSRLNRAHSLPVKYCYQPSNAMLLSHSRRCRLPP